MKYGIKIFSLILMVLFSSLIISCQKKANISEDTSASSSDKIIQELIFGFSNLFCYKLSQGQFELFIDCTNDDIRIYHKNVQYQDYVSHTLSKEANNIIFLDKWSVEYKSDDNTIHIVCKDPKATDYTSKFETISKQAFYELFKN